ncbi:Protein GUCD1 [Galdieria sulphuraria]|nr:Protein GUCD1 [Galdieria sulphuraria]
MQFISETFAVKNCPIVGSSTNTKVSAIDQGEEEEEEWESWVPLVPHWRQRFCWDCGVACSYMILRYYGLQVPVNELYEKLWTQSVWTIDLVLLLHSYGLQLTYYTVTWGVRLEYSKQEFYQPHFQEDRVRVQRLFGVAKSQNLKILRQSVSLEELKKRLKRDCLVRKYSNNTVFQKNAEKGELLLLLVDKRLLKCKLCQRKTSALSWFKKLCFPGFLGHYIILWGYCPRKDIFWYSDPASCQRFCIVRSDVLELCRKSYGTDEDLIVVHGFHKPS